MVDTTWDELMLLDLLAEPPDSPVAQTTHDRRAKRQHRMRPLLVRAREAARLLGVSVSTLRRLNAAGSIPASVTVGRLKLWSQRTLRLWDKLGCPPRVEFERLQSTETARPS